MSSGIVRTRQRARSGSLLVGLGCAATAAWADCPPGYQPWAGGCQKASMTPHAICSYAAANHFPATSPDAGTKEFQQKKQEYIATCVKQYEEQARSARLVRAAPQPADNAGAVAPAPRAAVAPRETAPARVAAPREMASDAPLLEKVPEKSMPDVTLTCALTAKGVKLVASGGYPSLRRMYELTAANKSGASVPAGYRVHWSVQPLAAAPAPAQGRHQIQAALAPNAQINLGTVLAAEKVPLQQCQAVARL